MSLKDVFIHNVKNYRALRGFSQMKLAELCNTSTSYIGQIEIGNRFPSLEMIEKIAKALQIRPNLLFLEEIDRNTTEPLPSGKHVLPDSVKEDLIQRLTIAVRHIVKRTG
jgi:transcriptional regulator with XRE-family HTH domain